MPDSFKIEFSSEAHSKASARFYQLYGHTLAEWSRIERGLFLWFLRATKMNEPVGRAVFYSGKSFNSRADMLKEAIDTSNGLCEDERAFAKAIIRLAWKYSSFRNQITHGEAVLCIDENNNQSINFMIRQGKTSIGLPHITEEELFNALVNFSLLKELTFSVIPALREGLTFQQLLVRVQSLPTEAHSRSDQTQKEHQQQPPRPDRPNKKAYRAQQKSERDKKKQGQD